MNIAKELIRELWSYNKLAIILVLVEMSKAVGFISTAPDSIVYLAILIFAFTCCNNIEKFETSIILLLLYIPLEILLANPDPLFKSWYRYLGFVLGFLAVSPLIQSEKARLLRKQALLSLAIVSTILSIISFFCYFLGINFMRAGMYDTVYQAGTFGGLFRQSMLLGPIAGFASVFTSYNAHIKKRKEYWVLSIMCIGAVLFSASRSALMATIAGNVVMLYFGSKGKSRFIKTIMIITLLASVTFPLWEDATQLVLEKQANNTASGSMLMSRETKWINRIDEFKSSPLWGVGFSSVDVSYTGDYLPHNGQIEPGSSWLVIISMLGIIGALIILPIFMTCYKANKNMNDDISALYLGLLALIAIHMVAEGYIFASGGFLFFMMWLIISVAFDQKYNNINMQ